MGLLQGLLGRFEFVFEFEDVLSEVVNLCLELVLGGTVISSVLLGALFVRDGVTIHHERDELGVSAVNHINE